MYMYMSRVAAGFSWFSKNIPKPFLMYMCMFTGHVCKQYYKEVLTRELKNNSETSAYLQCNEPVDKVIQSHLGFMEQHGIDAPKDFIKIPSFYWLPKLYKNPYGHRFIAASSACTTKLLP